MKKIYLLLLAALTLGLYAQETAPQTQDPARQEKTAPKANVDVSLIGNDKSDSDVKHYLLDQFNIETAWTPVMFADVASVSIKYLDRPDKAASEEGEVLAVSGEAVQGESRSVALGVKVSFLKRAAGEELFLKRRTPIHISGITKAFTLWVCGRGLNHELYVRTKNPDGTVSDIPFENPRLNSIGWKQLVAYVPPTINQEDAFAPDKPGFDVLGLVIKFNAAEMVRSYYVYFDDLEAYTDVVYVSQFSNVENMVDEW